MKFTVILFAFMLICGCQSDPIGISLVYRRYEPTRGGRILITSAPEQFTEDIQRYRHKEQQIMSDVCAPQGYKIVDEGIESAPGSITSYRLPYGQRESVIGYSVAQFKNFRCTDEKESKP